MINKMFNGLQKVTKFINTKYLKIYNGSTKFIRTIVTKLNDISRWFMKLYLSLETNIITIITAIIKFFIQIRLGVYILLVLFFILFYYSLIVGIIAFSVIILFTIIGDEDEGKIQEVSTSIDKFLNKIHKPIFWFVRFILIGLPTIWVFIMIKDNNLMQKFFNLTREHNITNFNNSHKKEQNTFQIDFIKYPNGVDFEQLKKSCLNNNNIDCYDLAILYAKGEVIPANKAKALSIFNKLCNSGFKKACVGQKKLETYMIKK